jgi:carbon starvation protein CstA
VWFVVAAICTYVIGYRFYARLIETKVVRPRDDHATPAEVFDDGRDYLSTFMKVGAIALTGLSIPDAAAKAAGKTAFGSTKTSGQLDEVIRNTFVQGTLSVIFASVVAIVVVAAIILVYRTIRGQAKPLTEDDPVPSRLFAPSGVIANPNERELQKQWDELGLMPTRQSSSKVSSTEPSNIDAS